MLEGSQRLYISVFKSTPLPVNVNYDWPAFLEDQTGSGSADTLLRLLTSYTDGLLLYAMLYSVELLLFFRGPTFAFLPSAAGLKTDAKQY
jgi:hypothetical protein